MHPPLPLSLAPLQQKQSQFSPLAFGQQAHECLDLLAGHLGNVHAVRMAWCTVGVCQAPIWPRSYISALSVPEECSRARITIQTTAPVGCEYVCNDTSVGVCHFPV
jgi:hypothetical protein